MILSILKIIGIILLIIIAIIIVVLGIVLFVPIRYQFHIEYEGNPGAEAVVKWTPLFLNAMVEYRDGKPEYVVRMFGGVVLTNRDMQVSWLGRKLFSSKDEEPEAPPLVIRESQPDLNQEVQRESVSNDKMTESIRTKQPKQKKYKKSRQNWFEKIQKMVHELRNRIRHFIQKLKALKEKKDALQKVYHSKRFQVAKKDVILYIKEAFRILKPKKAEGYVHFGMEDPATTGEILGLFAMFLPYYEAFLDVRPDFEQACLEGKIKGKGKIYLILVVILSFKVIMNKNLIKVIKKVQTIIEA